MHTLPDWSAQAPGGRRGAVTLPHPGARRIVSQGMAKHNPAPRPWRIHRLRSSFCSEWVYLPLAREWPLGSGIVSDRLRPRAVLSDAEIGACKRSLYEEVCGERGESERTQG